MTQEPDAHREPAHVWTAIEERRLTEAWNLGLTTIEIAVHLFGDPKKKNMIVGKKNRLKLSKRPSPIGHRAPGGAPPPYEKRTMGRPSKDSLPPLASNAKAAVTAIVNDLLVDLPPLPEAVVAPPIRREVFTAPAQPEQAKIISYTRRPSPCCWPIGTPGKPDFRFCDDVSVPGKPYCEYHHRLAYIKIRDRREDAA